MGGGVERVESQEPVVQGPGVQSDIAREPRAPANDVVNQAIHVDLGASSARIVSRLDLSFRPEWARRVSHVPVDLARPAAAIRRLLHEAQGADALIVDGAMGGRDRLVDFTAAAILARRRTGPRVIFTDATWGRGTHLADRLACRVGLQAIDSPRTVYCVLASGERELFARTWGVPLERVAFTPFCVTVPDAELDAAVTEDGTVFAGGNSLRDYGPLLRIAGDLDVPVTIATRLLHGAAVPPNVRAGAISPQAFLDRLRSASVVVVPLAVTRERSAGQQTYLNAMAQGKLVIVTDVLGVRDYVEPDRTGLLVPPGDGPALLHAIRWALDPLNAGEVAAIRARARTAARNRFSGAAYVSAILRATDRALLR
jgi:hypothetical protein